jgi:hypothetical protein
MKRTNIMLNDEQHKKLKLYAKKGAGLSANLSGMHWILRI